jgi:hypothetical protein
MSRCHALLGLDSKLTSGYMGMAVLGTHKCMQHSRSVCRWVLSLVAILCNMHGLPKLLSQTVHVLASTKSAGCSQGLKIAQLDKL